jgi:hypothetical protein
MNPAQPNIMQQARQAMPPQAPQGAAAGQPMKPQKGMINPSGLPVPPPGVAMMLAQKAATMPPMVLGTLIWRGLQQHGQATGQLTQHFHDPMAQGAAPQMGQPTGGVQ